MIQNCIMINTPRAQVHKYSVLGPNQKRNNDTDNSKNPESSLYWYLDPYKHVVVAAIRFAVIIYRSTPWSFSQQNSPVRKHHASVRAFWAARSLLRARSTSQWQLRVLFSTSGLPWLFLLLHDWQHFSPVRTGRAAPRRPSHFGGRTSRNGFHS